MIDLEEVIEEMETQVEQWTGSEKRYQEWLSGKKQRKNEHSPDYLFLVRRSDFDRWLSCIKAHKGELERAIALSEVELSDHD